MKWLVFFSSLPTKPVGNRVKVWRKLVKSGAVQIKGAAYVLPSNEAHVEFLQWLVQEISGMGGEAAFTRVAQIETMADPEIIALFHRRKDAEYKDLAGLLDVAERRIEGLRQGATPAAIRKGVQQLAKIRKNVDDARRTDFFSASSGAQIETRLARNLAALQSLAGTTGTAEPGVTIPRRCADDYRGKRWLTRTKPFVDRMASAWLIRKWIDPGAVFAFHEQPETLAEREGTVMFDVTGGEFTHVGDLCTFEVLARSFELKDRALGKVAEIVHELDIKDDRYRTIESPGVEEILSGIPITARDDADALERGMAIFELLYAAKSR